MSKQGTFIAHPKTEEESKAIKAFLKALDINFEETTEEESPYDPEFVAKIQKSRKQAREGKTVNIDLDDIWKE